MDTSIINIRTDAKLKKAAMKVANDLGFNLSSLINAYLKNLVRTRAVYVSNSEVPSDYLIQTIREAEEERKKGNYHAFKNNDEALSFLDDIIAGKK